MEFSGSHLLFSLAFLGFLSFFTLVYRVVVCNPRKLRSELAKQGIKGPTPCFLYGNMDQMKRIQSTTKTKDHPYHQCVVSHDYYRKLFPYFEQWKIEYGSLFMYSKGIVQHLYVSDPVIVKEIVTNMSMDIGKPIYMHKARKPLLGDSILTINGPLWAHQRKIITPQFFMDKVKGMINLMMESTVSLVESWDNRIESKGVAKINVDEDLRSISADIISKACFGSSYSQGKNIFERLRDLHMAVSKQGLIPGVPSLRHLPTKSNRELWKLEKEVDSLILKVVKKRKEDKGCNDLLQMILEGANNEEAVKLYSVERFIIDNCKSIYFAGHETTATTVSWILLLLAKHQDWQTRVREEVVGICGNSLPDVDMLSKMKQLTMVIQETLRLYPASLFVPREALQGKKIGDLYVPKGVNLCLPVIALHQDPEIWGPDAMEFNPNRFSNGISKACKIPQVYMPFGIGARTCLGQNFAMVEMKILISVILTRFSVTLSPNYKHCPEYSIVLQPKYGIELVLGKM